VPIITNNLLYEKTSETATKPVVAHRATVDFLTTCVHNCRGCFVNKGNTPYTQHDLDLLEHIAASVNDAGMLFDELVVGPVDFFGAANSKQLLMEPKLQKFMATHKPIFAIPTTLRCDDQVILDFVKLFNELYPHPYLEFELQVVVDPKQFTTENQEYLDLLKHKIRLFDGMIARVCYTIQINIQKLTNLSLHTMSLLAMDQFKTIIDYNPSFFRSHNPRTIRTMLNHWNNELERQVTPENRLDIQMVVADWTHGGHNYSNWIISGGNVYISPFIHENVANTTEAFLVPREDDNYELSDLLNASADAKRDQFKYADVTDECHSCKYLDTCVSRYVLFYMEKYGMTNCLLPKKVLDLYPKNLGDLTYNIYDWKDYTVEGEIAEGNKEHHEFAENKGIL